jgi:glycosyltransferase involved in cell wall biosynthesis
MLEAMAAGLPTVAHRLPAVSELHADGDSAFLVPPEDTGALAAALRALALDPGRRRAMGEQARRRVRDSSMEAMVEAYVRLWRASVPARV